MDVRESVDNAKASSQAAESRLKNETTLNPIDFENGKSSVVEHLKTQILGQNKSQEAMGIENQDPLAGKQHREGSMKGLSAAQDPVRSIVEQVIQPSLKLRLISEPEGSERPLPRFEFPISEDTATAPPRRTKLLGKIPERKRASGGADVPHYYFGLSSDSDLEEYREDKRGKVMKMRRRLTDATGLVHENFLLQKYFRKFEEAGEAAELKQTVKPKGATPTKGKPTPKDKDATKAVEATRPKEGSQKARSSQEHPAPTKENKNEIPPTRRRPDHELLDGGYTREVHERHGKDRLVRFVDDPDSSKIWQLNCLADLSDEEEVRDARGGPMTRTQMMRSLRVYNQEFGRRETKWPKSTLEIQHIVAAVAAYEHYKKNMHYYFQKVVCYTPPQNLHQLHIEIIRDARGIFLGTLKGIEDEVLFGEYLEKLVLKIDSTYSEYKSLNHNRKTLRQIRTAGSLLFIFSIATLALRGLVELGIYSLASLFALLLGVTTVALCSWIYVSISGRCRKVGYIVESSVDVFWTLVLRVLDGIADRLFPLFDSH